MIDRKHDFPINQQPEVVGISRGSVDYPPRPVLKIDFAIVVVAIRFGVAAVVSNRYRVC